MSRSNWLMSMILVGLLASSDASADFISSDINGQATATDLHTGLTWLNWGETQGWSRPEIESELREGGEFEGWRYATHDELRGMLRFFFPFFDPIDPNYSEGTQYGLTTASYDDPLLFDSLITSEMSLFSRYIGGAVDAGHSISTQAIYGDVAFGVDSGGILLDMTQTALVFDSLIAEPSWEDRIVLYTYVYQESSSRIGHALVKESRAVSEPGTLALFAVSLFGIGMARRRGAG